GATIELRNSLFFLHSSSVIRLCLLRCAFSGTPLSKRAELLHSLVHDRRRRGRQQRRPLHLEWHHRPTRRGYAERRQLRSPRRFLARHRSAFDDWRTDPVHSIVRKQRGHFVVTHDPGIHTGRNGEPLFALVDPGARWQPHTTHHGRKRHKILSLAASRSGSLKFSYALSAFRHAADFSLFQPRLQSL